MRRQVRRSIDLALAVAIAILTLVLVLNRPDAGLFRALPVLLLVLVIPGYIFLAILFPRRMPAMPVSLCLVPALSVSFTLLGGVLLNLGKAGLTAETYAWSLSIFTVLGAVIAFIRRLQYPADGGAPLRIGLNVGQVFLFVLALAIVALAFVTARDGAAQPTASFTQLWLLPSSVDDLTHLRLGVKNDETESITYRLVVKNGDKVLNEWPTLNLASNAQWETVLNLPATIDTPIQALLYRADQPGVIYRNVTWRTGTSRK